MARRLQYPNRNQQIIRNGNGQIPFMYDDNAPEVKVELQQPSNVRYWPWLSPWIYILAIVPALILVIMGLDVNGPRKENVWNAFIGAGSWWLLIFCCFVWVIFR